MLIPDRLGSFIHSGNDDDDGGFCVTPHAPAFPEGEATDTGAALHPFIYPRGVGPARHGLVLACGGGRGGPDFEGDWESD